MSWFFFRILDCSGDMSSKWLTCTHEIACYSYIALQLLRMMITMLHALLDYDLALPDVSPVRNASPETA